jgi:DNA-directed RNA polymerase specialized sigma24 family protein
MAADREFLDFFADEFWPLRRIGFLLTGDWGEAEELAQEAMARTFGGPKPGPPSPLFKKCVDRGQPSRLAPWPS